MSFAKQSIFYREMNDTNLNFYLYKINVKAEGFIFNFWRIRPPLLFWQGVKNFCIFLGCYLLVGQGMSLIFMWIYMHWWRLFLWCHNDQICGIFVFHLIFELNVIMSILQYIYSAVFFCVKIFFSVNYLGHLSECDTKRSWPVKTKWKSTIQLPNGRSFWYYVFYF